ncbi:MAG: DUF2330 domain-containing protein [Bacteroidetes bacterium]|nr:DUF2330 domain-containing protein [Bacteroidota bacterium]
MKMKHLIIGVAVMLAPGIMSFCGFYVSKADGTLKNKTSQVILVRDGNKTVITMYNDFKGDTKDFAMVVPVPVVLKQEDIKVVDQDIFQRLNDYSAPRLVEYWDRNPCNNYPEMAKGLTGKVAGVQVSRDKYMDDAEKKETVKIEAKYLVGEYDILILSATESTGLKEWLLNNGYKIPDGAEEVLDPYIKSNLKFFVVKVNEKEKQKLNNNFLRPIQIKFNSPKFMLPIRLGMANADGDQDLIVYAFTRKGRIECTNYRNVNIATDKNIPLFVQKNFGMFYNNLFNHQWSKENKSVAFLEYAWDVSPQNYYHCDPCIATAPGEQDLVQSGVWWLGGKDWSDYSDVDNDEPDNGSKNVHFTRLHFRYNRNSFPQDLFFQVTPNTETFQARYIITHPANGDFTCDAGKKYLQDLKVRRKKELQDLTALTGTNLNNWQQDATAAADEETDATAQYRTLIPEVAAAAEHEKTWPASMIIMSALVLGGAGFMRWKGMV